MTISSTYPAQLCGVDADKFAQTFKFKTLQDPVSKKIIRMDRNPEDAGYTRHATAKVLYGRLFDWLVSPFCEQLTA